MDIFEPEWLLRILCAMIMGVLIGYERHNRSKEAGIRTHAIVAVASCMIMIVSKYGFADTEKVDAARLAAQVVSGIGFLGAGIIFVRNDVVQGLTTAAGLWGTGALGLCFGAGLYRLGIFTGMLLFIIHTLFFRFLRYSPPRSVMTVRLHLSEAGTSMAVNELLYSLQYKHSDNHISSDGSGGWYLKTTISTHKNVQPAEVKRELEKADSILEVDIL